jgi:hypothetical protein
MAISKEGEKTIVHVAHSEKVKYLGALEKIAIGLEGLQEFQATCGIATKDMGQLGTASVCASSIRTLFDEMNVEIEVAN